MSDNARFRSPPPSSSTKVRSPSSPPRIQTKGEPTPDKASPSKRNVLTPPGTPRSPTHLQSPRSIKKTLQSIKNTSPLKKLGKEKTSSNSSLAQTSQGNESPVIIKKLTDVFNVVSTTSKSNARFADNQTSRAFKELAPELSREDDQSVATSATESLHVPAVPKNPNLSAWLNDVNISSHSKGLSPQQLANFVFDEVCKTSLQIIVREHHMCVLHHNNSLEVSILKRYVQEQFQAIFEKNVLQVLVKEIITASKGKTEAELSIVKNPQEITPFFNSLLSKIEQKIITACSQNLRLFMQEFIKMFRVFCEKQVQEQKIKLEEGVVSQIIKQFLFDVFVTYTVVDFLSQESDRLRETSKSFTGNKNTLQRPQVRYQADIFATLASLFAYYFSNTPSRASQTQATYARFVDQTGVTPFKHALSSFLEEIEVDEVSNSTELDATNNSTQINKSEKEFDEDGSEQQFDHATSEQEEKSS